MMTEAPLNTPQNRESLAEVMFETIGVPGLYIGVQAVLALASSIVSGEEGKAFFRDRLKETTSKHTYRTANDSQMDQSNSDCLSGVVLDIGDGMSQVIPIIDGYIIPSAIRSMPIGGRDLTHFLQSILRERESIDSGKAFELARQIKEQCCWTIPAESSLPDEMARFFAEKKNEMAKGMKPKYFNPIVSKQIKGSSYNATSYDATSCNATACDTTRIELGFETFLTPEVLFDPCLLTGASNEPGIHHMLDAAIQACPIDSRRHLYANIALSGGGSMFPGLHGRLHAEMQSLVAERYSVDGMTSKSERWLNGTGSVGENVPRISIACSTDAEVKESSLWRSRQGIAVWHGGSVLASSPLFSSHAVSKADYEEYGPSICRQTKALSSL